MSVPEPPKPPKNRIMCLGCGIITETGHTSWECKLRIWLQGVFGK